MIILQKPNKYLYIMGGAWLVSNFTNGLLHSIANALFIIFGIIWAYEEITTGVNWFRKLLGITIMILFLIKIIQISLK
jgi:hypothetical protein